MEDNNRVSHACVSQSKETLCSWQHCIDNLTKKLKSRLCNWNSGGAMSGGGKKREIFRIVWERFRKKYGKAFR